MTRILLVDDDKTFCHAIAELLFLMKYDVDVVHSVKEAAVQLKKAKYSHVLLDFMLPDGSGLHLIDQINTDQKNITITLTTGHPSVKNAMAGFCTDNINYLIKPITKQKLESVLVKPKDNTPQIERHFGYLIGESIAMQKIYPLIERVAKSDANVLLMGESGSGKEVFAQAINYASGCDKALVATNCGAFAKELIGSELFGHEKGAFTGAVAKRVGLFEQAKDGNLFLDEITEMPIEEQPNLLRVLETNQITRLGSTQTVPVNCRVISATNRTTEEIATQNVMREDLYFRLAVFPIHIPPLRHRKEDIPLLVTFFLEGLNTQHGTHITCTADQLKFLTAYDWPGNVRELKHAIHRAYIMSNPETNELVLPDNFASPFTKKPQVNTSQDQVGRTIEDVEKDLITQTLKECNNDKTRAAQMLGVSLKTLYNRLNKYTQDEIA